jgi:hypothetical protein
MAVDPTNVDDQVEGSRYSSRSRRFTVFVLLALTGVFLASIILPLSDGDYFTICAFKNVTGFPCPGCGLTHSFCALARGRLERAFEYNLLGPPVFVCFLVVWIRSACELAGWNKPALAFDHIANRFRLIKVFAVAFVIFGLGRIVYLLIYSPEILSGSPLARLISWINH